MAGAAAAVGVLQVRGVQTVLPREGCPPRMAHQPAGALTVWATRLAAATRTGSHVLTGSLVRLLLGAAGGQAAGRTGGAACWARSDRPLGLVEESVFVSRAGS